MSSISQISKSSIQIVKEASYRNPLPSKFKAQIRHLRVGRKNEAALQAGHSSACVRA